MVGVTAPTVFPDRPGPNEFVEEERPAPHLMERIHQLTDASAGSIALPGSVGTLAELILAWNLAYVARFRAVPPKPVVAVGPEWQRLVPLLDEALPDGAGLITPVASVEEAVAQMTRRLSHDPSPPGGGVAIRFPG